MTILVLDSGISYIIKRTLGIQVYKQCVHRALKSIDITYVGLFASLGNDFVIAEDELSDYRCEGTPTLPGTNFGSANSALCNRDLLTRFRVWGPRLGGVLVVRGNRIYSIHGTGGAFFASAPDQARAMYPTSSTKPHNRSHHETSNKKGIFNHSGRLYYNTYENN